MAHKDTSPLAAVQQPRSAQPDAGTSGLHRRLDASQVDINQMDIIFVEGFTGETVIGIHESELHRPQPLVIDVHAGLSRARACDTDSIADTIDYGEVRARLRRLMAEHRLQLLEAFAEAIADILILEFGAAWVRVKVIKPRKFDDVDAVGVQIERTAADVASRQSASDDRPSRGAAVLRLLGAGMVPGDR